MEDLIIAVGYFAAISFLLFIGGIISDYIFPMIKPLDDYLRKLAEEKEDVKWRM